MINLIPPQAKKIVLREYWLRVVAAWLLLLSFVLFALATLSFPTYLLIEQLNQSLVSDIQAVAAKQVSYSEIENTVKNINALVNHLNTNREQVKFSSLLAKLDAIDDSHVTLDQFVFVEEQDVLKKIELIGHADTRSDLSAFRDAVEKSEEFDAVELPISNLAKDKDLSFSMDVFLALPKQ